MARRRQNHQNPEDDPAGGDDRPPAHRLVQAVAREDRVGHELHRAERGQEGLRREREGHEVHHAAEHEQRPSAEAHQHAAALGRDAQPLGLLVLVVAHLDHVRAQVDEHIPGHLRRRVHTQTDCGLEQCVVPRPTSGGCAGQRPLTLISAPTTQSAPPSFVNSGDTSSSDWATVASARRAASHASMRQRPSGSSPPPSRVRAPGRAT